jgi:hypothetical protein
MQRQTLSAWLILFFVGFLTGCGSSQVAETPLPGIDDSLETPLAQLLAKPRAELATLSEEWAGKVADQEKAVRIGDLRCTVLPELRFPHIVPVWREAAFSARTGISLPPYAAEGTHDAELALHLARYGDAEAAAQLAGDNSDVKAKLAALRYARSYPVEWTRLVALMQQSAQLRLATGDIDGAKELVALHRQVRRVLDPKAAEGPLGALLSRGHKALADAVLVLRQESDKELATQIDKALQEWGVTPSLVGSIPWGASRADVARLLGCSAKDKVLQTTNPARALDLLALPIPGDGVQALTAFFNGDDKLTQLLVTYIPSAAKNFPEPNHFGYLLEDRDTPSKEASKSVGLNRRTYVIDDVACQVLVLPRASAAGALVCFRAANQAAESSTALRRDFGAVHLDRGFEQNRVRLAPEQKGETIQTKRPAVLAEITSPLGKTPPSVAYLKKNSGQDATMEFVLRYVWDHNQPPLHQLAMPLWQTYGPAQFTEVEDESGSQFLLSWHDDKTRYSLRLPNVEEAPSDLVVQNERADKDATAATGGTTFDQAERKARIASGKPLTRLPRILEGVQLGQTKDQALAALPQGQSILKLPIADGLSVTINTDAPKTATSQAKHLLIRFDAAGKVAEIRARYQAGPASKPGEWPGSVLARWKKYGGAASERPAPWARVWEDPAEEKAPALLTWHDDLTRASFVAESGSADVTLRDCPVDHPEGAPLPGLAYLPRGPEQCLLGTSKADLLKAWNVKEPTTAPQVDLVLYPPKTSEYDAYLIWFEGDKVARVVARIRPPSDTTKQTTVSQVLSEAWGRDLRFLGWPNRQEFSADQELSKLSWLDERTRIRIYWQETDASSARVFTEWKDLSAPAKSSAAKP